MEKFIGDVSYYYSNVKVAFGRAPLPSMIIVAVWYSIPCAIQMVLHPSDAIRFQHYWSGEAIPIYFTSSMLTSGEITALVTLAALNLLLLGANVLFLRRWQYDFFALWPLAGVLVGILGNAFWWRLLQGFDPIGALVGFGPLGLAVGCEWVCEQLGKDFIFGRGVRPRFEGQSNVL